MGEDNDEKKEAKGDTMSVVLEIVGTLSEQFLGVNIVDLESMAMPENPVADVGDMPNLAKWFSFFLYQGAFIAVFIYFIYDQYQQGRNSSFITLDNTSGVCKGEPSSTTCCEVPQSISGTFLADTQGNWDTDSKFSYIQNNYAVTVAGLEYTNEQWATVMKNITAQIKTIGLKGVNRDFAWNLVAWSSFTAQNLEQGFLQFYATGLTGIIYDKQLIQVGFASGVSETQECNLYSTMSYNSETSTVNIQTVLCNEGPCKENPCPNITSPQGMGYDYLSTTSNIMSIDVSMEAVTTALAVNMGMITLNHLVMVPGDNDRTTLLNNMVDAGYLTKSQANHTSSYYDNLYAPTKVIYCHSQNAPVNDLTHTWDSGLAFCMVRIGNLLTYPVTASYGWSYSGVDYPSKCTSSAVSSESAAHYYCNLLDITVSLIYYPVDNLNPNVTYTYRPTMAPSQRPTPLPGQPTLNPTHCRTSKPSIKPSGRPTPLPGYPTIRPSYKATGKPTTFRPTPLPGKPTRCPTIKPSAKPSTSAVPTTSFRPSVSPKPTQKPTVSQHPTLVPTVNAAVDSRIMMAETQEQVDFMEFKREYFHRKHILADVPTDGPTEPPADAPTDSPASAPADAPTESPASAPADAPTDAPTDVPTDSPVEEPGYSTSTSSNYNYNYYSNYYNFYNYYSAGPYYVPATGQAYSYVPQEFDDTSSSATAYSGSSASEIYAANAESDDFQPLNPIVIDNGKIYAFGQNAANQFLVPNNTQADIYVNNIAFDAISDTIYGTAFPDNNGKYHNYADDFAKLCSSDVDVTVSSGCAMMSFEIYGGQNRAISEYYYQPSSTPAFSNTLYVASELVALQKNTPTSLIQTYYSCVLAPWPAFYAAVGLGAASVGVWVPLAFAIYMLITVQWLNYFNKAEIPALKKKEREEARAAEARDKDIDIILAQFKALRQDVMDGRIHVPRLMQAIDRGDDVINVPEGGGTGKNDIELKDVENPMTKKE